jgi:uncharacterized protein (TIRG00374 family)
MEAWIVSLSPLVALTVNVLTQIVTVHFTKRIGFSIILGLLSGLLADGLLLSWLDASWYVSLPTYFALSFCFWAFLNLHITSMRIRFIRELHENDQGLSLQHLLQQYSPREAFSRRLGRLFNNKQIINRDGRWVLVSRGLLIFVYVSNFLRRLIVPKANRPQIFWLMIKIFLTGCLLWLLYHYSQLQFGLLVTFIHHPFSTLVIMGLCYLMVIFHAWRWYRLNAAQHISLSFPRTILPAYMAIAFNNVLPGSIGGDFFRLYFVLQNFPTQKSNTILSIFVDRITGLLGILIIACLATPFYVDAIRHHTVLYYLVSISFIFCITCLLCFFTAVFLLSEKVGLAKRIEELLQKMKYAQQLLALLKAIQIYRNAKLIVLESLIVSMATQVLLLMVVMLISHSMGLPALPLGIYMLALVIGQIANLVPLTPGGIGVGEAAFANIIYLLHPGSIAAYATIFFALRLLSTLAYLPGVLIGVFGFHYLHRNQESYVYQ